MENTKLSPPWVNYYNQLNALFGKDHEIHINYQEEPPVITMYIDSQRKYEALCKLLPMEKQFGNVTVKVILVPADNSNETDYAELFGDAFKGNPAVSDIVTAQIMAMNMTYIVFAKEVVQYFNDEINDIHGNKSTLYQDIAREVFDVPGNVGFGTATE